MAVRAQVVPPPAGEVPIPPAPETDTTARDVPAPIQRDTIKTEVGRATAPAGVSLAPRYVWEGDQILASGAYTLADLLNHVPEITIFRSGWIHSPQFAAVAGDLSRVRVFLDGIELDAIGPREFGLLELGKIPIWTLQRVAVERAGSEVRVHLRTWTVDRTTAYTRVDVYTGTEDTDIYRGLFGKRFNNGGILQVAGQQASTENRSLGGSGDGLGLMLRTGFGWRLFSVDAFAQRASEHRTQQIGADVAPLPVYDATNTNAYLRAALGRVDRGPWVELIAATQRTKGNAITAEGAADTVDTIVSRLQYVASAGIRAGPLSVTFADRLRRYDDSSHNSVSGRLELVTRVLESSAYAEQSGEYRVTDAMLRFQPFRFIALSGGASRRQLRSIEDDDGRDTVKTDVLRAEAGLNLGGIWLYGGTLSFDGNALVPVSPFEEARGTTVSPFPPPDPEAPAPERLTARFAGLRGIGWRGLGANTYVMRWNQPALYVPEYQARTELNFQTQWLSRFPSGDFGFRIAAADEFRSAITFANDSRAPASHVLWGLIEIRILRATLTFQTRNPLGRRYFIIPGYEMPRTISTYGVRWHFWD